MRFFNQKTRFLTSLKKIRVYLTTVKGLASPLLCNRLIKMGDVHSRNIGNRNIVRDAFLSIHCWSAAMSSPPLNVFPESLGNIENLNQVKAEVKKRYFLISFFFPINFTCCKVDNYAFNYQIAIVKLAEKPFYGVG